MNRKQQFKEGLITNNPVLVQQIGMCATMAITTTLFNGVGNGQEGGGKLRRDHDGDDDCDRGAHGVHDRLRIQPEH